MKEKEAPLSPEARGALIAAALVSALERASICGTDRAFVQAEDKGATTELYKARREGQQAYAAALAAAASEIAARVVGRRAAPGSEVVLCLGGRRGGGKRAKRLGWMLTAGADGKVRVGRLKAHNARTRRAPALS